MTRGVDPISMFRSIFFNIDAMKMPPSEVYNLNVRDCEILQNMWIVERKREIEIRRKGRK